MTRNRKNRTGCAYRQENEAFLAEKAKEEGVIVLDNGVIMKRTQNGSGTVHPKPGSLVYVRYTGRLIDGTVFDSTEGETLPALFKVRDLIMGWQIALTRMYEGDKYRIWIPAKWAYGSMRQPDIPAWSTLEFDLELVKIAQI